MSRVHQKLSFHVSFAMATTRAQEPTHPPGDVVPIVELIIMAIAALSTLAVVSRCSWTWRFMFAGSRSTPQMGKRLQCAVMASISAMLDFCDVITPNSVTTTMRSFGWLMSSHLIMQMMPGGQSFIAFAGGLMQLLLVWPTILVHHLVSLLQRKKEIKLNNLENKTMLIIQLFNQWN